MGVPGVVITIGAVDKFSSVFSKGTASLQTFGEKSKQVGAGLTAVLTAPIIGAGFAGVQTALTLNKTMGNISTLLDGTNSEILDRTIQLKKIVQDTAIATGRSAEETAGGMFELISAFGDSAELAKQLQVNTLSAVGGQATLAESIALTASVTKSYGDTSAEAMQQVSDLAFVTNKLGSTNFQDLAANVGKVAPLAYQANISMEEMFATIASAAGVTGDTAEMTTQFSNLAASFIKPTKNMDKAIRSLGYQSGAEMVKQLGLMGSLQALEGVTKKYGVTLGKVFESKEGLILAQTLLTTLSADYTTKLGALGSAQGATAKAFDVQANGINKAGVQLDIMRQKVDASMVALGDRLLPILVKLTDTVLMPLAEKFASLNDEQMDFVIAVGSIIAIIGPAIFVIGSLATFITSASAAFAILNVWMLATTGSAIGLNVATGGILLAIAALITLLVVVIMHWKTIWEWTQKYIIPTFKVLANIFGVLFLAFNPVLGLMVLFIANFKEIKKLVEGAASWLGNVFGGGGSITVSGEGNSTVAQGTSLGASTSAATAAGGTSGFNGVLRLENVPRGSQVDVGKSTPGFNLDVNYGLAPVGVRQ